MRKGGGRNKGSAFEREVAAAIIDTFACVGVCKEDCYRTPGSGGHRFAKKEDPGDLVISGRLRKHWPFAVECKHYAKISLDLLMVPHIKQGMLYNWWVQARASAGKHVPLLVFRQNRQQAYAMFPMDMRTDLFEHDSRFQLRFRPAMSTKVAGDLVYVVRFKSLLRHYKRSVAK